jgi:hypothetical protein
MGSQIEKGGSVYKLIMLPLALSLGSMFATAQDCDPQRSGSPSEAIEYLRHVGDDPAAVTCINLAFHQIASLPPEQAIPLLVERIAYKRPLSEGERQGIFMHGKVPDVLYPAVHELYSLGKPSETALLRFIAENKDATKTARENAIYTLLLIHHGDGLSVVEALAQESKATDDAAARARLRSAARDAAKWCDDRVRVKCEDAQK